MHPNDPTAADAAAPEQQATPATWAIVELMGHAKIAGAVTQDVVCCMPLIRVDVPEVVNTEQVFRNGAPVEQRRVIPSHSRSLSAGAIYSVNRCDEVTARIAAYAIQHEPVKPYTLRDALKRMPQAERERLLALPTGHALITAVESDDDDRF